MPRASAALRSRLSLVHRSVDGLIKTEAIRCASVRPMPRLYRRRASIVSRTSPNCATRTCGKRSSSASVLVRSRSDPSASSAMMKGWITILPLVKMLTHFCVSRTEMVDPDRRICENQFAPPPAAWNILQLGHCASQGRQSACAFPLDEGLESFTNQRRFLRHPSEFLGDAYEIVIQRKGCSHRGTPGTDYSIK